MKTVPNDVGRRDGADREDGPAATVPIRPAQPPEPPEIPHPTTPGPAKPRRRRPGFLGAANVIFFCVLAIVWAWIPLGLFFGGLGSLGALGSGLILLFAWLYVQRGANYASYWWAELVYARGYRVPQIPASPHSGFKGYWHKQWLILKSWTFWRTTLYHYIKMVFALLVCLACFTILILGTGMLVVGIAGNPNGDLTFVIPWPQTPPLALRIVLVICGIVAVAASFVLLWFSAYLDRQLDEWFLPPTKEEELRAQVTTLEDARAGAVDAATTERLRIERDLHDGVQPMLVALSMKIGMAKSKLNPDEGGNPKDAAGARELVAEAHADSKAAITELRQLARGIHPSVLEDRGLDPAISALAARSAIPAFVRIDVPPGFRAGSEAESVAYFVIAEALTNAGKHSQATRIDVRVGLVQPSTLQIVVSDNGRGGARLRRDGGGTGLAGLADRVAAAKGQFSLTSPVGGPTTIAVEVPCA